MHRFVLLPSYLYDFICRFAFRIISYISTSLWKLHQHILSIGTLMLIFNLCYKATTVYSCPFNCLSGKWLYTLILCELLSDFMLFWLFTNCVQYPFEYLNIYSAFSFFFLHQYYLNEHHYNCFCFIGIK